MYNISVFDDRFVVELTRSGLDLGQGTPQSMSHRSAPKLTFEVKHEQNMQALKILYILWMPWHDFQPVQMFIAQSDKTIRLM